MARPDPQHMPQLLAVIERLRTVREARARFLRRWAQQSSGDLAEQFLATCTGLRRSSAVRPLLLKRTSDPDDRR
jgi:hypothetical protein